MDGTAKRVKRQSAQNRKQGAAAVSGKKRGNFLPDLQKSGDSRAGKYADCDYKKGRKRDRQEIRPYVCRGCAAHGVTGGKIERGIQCGKV